MIAVHAYVFRASAGGIPSLLCHRNILAPPLGLPNFPWRPWCSEALPRPVFPSRGQFKQRLSRRRWPAPIFSAWRRPEPKREYDAIIVGGGGHGLAPAEVDPVAEGVEVDPPQDAPPAAGRGAGAGEESLADLVEGVGQA